MPFLTIPDIEAELSYAYLHAVASACGFFCRKADALEDKHGIDAVIRAKGPFPDGGVMRTLQIDVQLKATTKLPTDREGTFGYWFEGVDRYEVLRASTHDVHRILVVLFLPKGQADWLKHGVEDLVLRRCAYWTSLRGAPALTTKSGTTIDLPKLNVLSPENLSSLVAAISRDETPRWEGRT